MTDAELAKFATPCWVDSVATVPLDEAAVMIAEDPSVLTALVGALRHARTERDEWKRLAELRGEEVARWAHESGTAKGKLDVAERRLTGATDALRAMRSWINQRKGTSDGLMPHQVQVLVDHIATEIANLERTTP